jgi:TRAP-type mannitol/chloroaromatic compound transport system permease small subunit
MADSDIELRARPAGNMVTRVFDWFIAAINAIGTFWIFVMMLLINADVFMRYLFNSPVRGVPLVISLSIVAIVFLQMPDALRNGRFTRSDAVIGRLLRRRPKLGNFLEFVYNVCGVFIMAILFHFTIPFFLKDYNQNVYAGNEGDFTLQLWPIGMTILIGTACCLIQYLRHTWYNVEFLADKGDGRGREPRS